MSEWKVLEGRSLIEAILRIGSEGWTPSFSESSDSQQIEGAGEDHAPPLPLDPANRPSSDRTGF